ncbi:MAG: hypothetical protein LBK25_08245 [Treponema sp.]|jgi:hypothetical protein|nr:hypothetical protein [Treponema sp.]
MKTEQEYLEVIKENGWTLFDIPYNQRTEAMYIAAVQQDGDILIAVPWGKRTVAVCVATMLNVSVFNKIPPLIRQTVIRELLITNIRDAIKKSLEMDDIKYGKFTLHKRADDYEISYMRDAQVDCILDFKKDDLSDFIRLCYTAYDFGKKEQV